MTQDTESVPPKLDGNLENIADFLPDIVASVERAITTPAMPGRIECDHVTTGQQRRKQIEELRAQLKRYSEALENDLQTGRERIASRVREALNYERSFGDASNILLDHLRDKPECRELLEDIDKSRNGRDPDDKPSELQELMEKHVATR